MDLNRDLRNRPIQIYAVFDKGAKSVQWSKDSLLKKWCWNNWTSIWKKNNSRQGSYIFYKKWIKMYHRPKRVIVSKHKSIKLQDNRRKCEWTCVYLWVFSYNTKCMIHGEKNDKWNFTKIKNFCPVKDTIKKMKIQATDWRKYL